MTIYDLEGDADNPLIDPLADSRRSLATGVSQRLEEMILAGELKAGERINESHLGLRLKVSRAPIREALRRLERHGLIETQPNRGAFVVQLDARDIAELFDIRIALEELVGRRAAERLDASRLAQIEAVLLRLTAHAEAGRSREYYRANLDLHALIVDAAGSRHLANSYAGVVKRLALYRIANPATPTDMRVSLSEHIGIVAALRRRDPTAAGQALADHCRSGYHRQFAQALEAP